MPDATAGTRESISRAIAASRRSCVQPRQAGQKRFGVVMKQTHLASRGFLSITSRDIPAPSLHQMKLLLARKADIIARDEDDNTALHLACTARGTGSRASSVFTVAFEPICTARA